MTIAVNSAYIPARPGNVKMRCLIWHNHPICARFEQSEQYPLNSETLKSLPDYIRNKVTSLPDVDGVWLREKIVYKSNFLRIKDELLETYSTTIQAYFDQTKFPSILIPLKPWVPHHMWKLDGSLFNPDVSSSSDNLAGNAASKLPHLSKWTHEVVSVSPDQIENLTTTVTVSGIDSSSDNTTGTTVTVTNTSPDAPPTGGLKATQVFMPSQYAVSQGQKASGDTNPAGVHWKVTKEQPLFQGEDFWVEFRRRAYASDQQEDKQPLLDKYSYLDVSTHQDADFVVNAGVVDIDENGAIVDESRRSFNFNSQPYYIIEMGAGTEHHYFIIIAYNAAPRLIHVSNTIPVLTKISDADGFVMAVPGIDISRVLSVYDSVGSKALIDQDILRVTIRQHLGRMVIVFNGHEDAPWVIERQDPVLNSGSPDWSTDPADYKFEIENMVIPATPISLYSGNLKVCWSFGPLIYEPKASITLPQAILVKGPVSAQDITLRLTEQSPNDSNAGYRFTPYLFYQDAEEYREFINNQVASTFAYQARPEFVGFAGKAPEKGKKSNSNVGTVKNSLIQILPRTKVISNEGDSGNQDTSGGQDTTGDGNIETQNPLSDSTLMNQFFYAEYSLSAGDYVFPVPKTQTTSNVQITEAYKISNCITPIATGWWLYVPAAGRAAVPAITDASSLVVEFSDNWTAQDYTKLDHSGSIKFLVSPRQTGNPNSTLASYVASLHDKTFFMRIYVWWEDGFGACTPNCSNCGGAHGCSDACCIFTGFAHGGVITSKGSNQKYMECQLFDYMKILQDMFFLNSPFFDGMRDFNAVYHILKIAGFRDGTENNLTVSNGLGASTDPHAPAQLIKILSDSRLAENISIAWPPGCASSQVINTWEYVLPSSYDVLQSPKFKFADGSKMEEAIMKIASQASKTFYFDNLGFFHYENRIEEQFAFTGLNPSGNPKMRFFASVLEMNNPGGCSQQYRQVLGAYTWKRNVADVVNAVHVMTTTPDGGPIWGGDVNYASRYDPTQPGYIGYQKMYVQTDGVFGNLEGVSKAVEFYASFFTAPVGITFEAYGTGHLKPLDIITFTGMRVDDIELNNQPFRLLSVSSTINPETNEWRTKYEGEWFFLNGDSPA